MLTRQAATARFNCKRTTKHLLLCFLLFIFHLCECMTNYQEKEELTLAYRLTQRLHLFVNAAKCAGFYRPLLFRPQMLKLSDLGLLAPTLL